MIFLFEECIPLVQVHFCCKRCIFSKQFANVTPWRVQKGMAHKSPFRNSVFPYLSNQPFSLIIIYRFLCYCFLSSLIFITVSFIVLLLLKLLGTHCTDLFTQEESKQNSTRKKVLVDVGGGHWRDTKRDQKKTVYSSQFISQWPFL